MAKTTTQKKSQTTQQLVQIGDIRDNLLILKNSSLRAVIEVSAINFELRSEDEQTAIVENFQNFLNSLDFPMQIVINSRRLNIDAYLGHIDEAAATLDNELLKIQSAEYRKFISEISGLANIMSKKFFVVVPLFIFEKPTGEGILQGIKSIFKPSASKINIDPAKFETYKIQMLQRVELVIDGLISLGLKSRLLESEELQNMFYLLYNPPVDVAPSQDSSIAENTKA